uniref:Radical SAM enzyme, TIGR01210 family n=1 Tax=Candidatus Kentrum sp. TC TaxID=2126339 RepID=A0A450YQC6_9GAMM|nr:MAG: radical SAM enzyme, TIGR01210 family [Candidatus Kentron sp. TC]
MNSQLHSGLQWKYKPPARLILILRGRPCRYARCKFCALPSQALPDISDEEFREAVERGLRQIQVPKEIELHEVFIYNFGNGLDPKNLPPSVLESVISWCRRRHPSLQLVSLENRPNAAYGFSSENLARVEMLLGKIQPELAIGYETKDDMLRNRVLRKGLSQRAFDKALGLLGQRGWWARVYLMLKSAPSIEDTEAQEELLKGAAFVLELGEKHSVPTRTHMNVTYVARGTDMEQWFREGIYAPPSLECIQDTFRQLKYIDPCAILGDDDEGLGL